MAKRFIKFIYCLTFIFPIGTKPLAPEVGIPGNKFQGDIKLTEDLEGLVKGVSPKTGWTWDPFRWNKNARGEVPIPYRIQSSEGFNQLQVNWILREFRDIEALTCVRFIPRTVESDFVEIINGDGCWSWLGRIGGRQELSIDSSQCIWNGIAAHEAIHAIGFLHMQSDIERDNYVTINWQNIEPGFEEWFQRVDPQWFSNFGVSYDLLSVMHYRRDAFSKNGRDTIVPHNRAYLDRIGSAPTISARDAQRINRMYDC